MKQIFFLIVDSSSVAQKIRYFTFPKLYINHGLFALFLTQNTLLKTAEFATQGNALLHFSIMHPELSLLFFYYLIYSRYIPHSSTLYIAKWVITLAV